MQQHTLHALSSGPQAGLVLTHGLFCLQCVPWAEAARLSCAAEITCSWTPFCSCPPALLAEAQVGTVRPFTGFPHHYPGMSFHTGAIFMRLSLARGFLCFVADSGHATPSIQLGAAASWISPFDAHLPLSLHHHGPIPGFTPTLAPQGGPSKPLSLWGQLHSILGT